MYVASRVSVVQMLHGMRCNIEICRTKAVMFWVNHAYLNVAGFHSWWCCVWLLNVSKLIVNNYRILYICLWLWPLMFFFKYEMRTVTLRPDSDAVLIVPYSGGITNQYSVLLFRGPMSETAQDFHNFFLRFS